MTEKFRLIVIGTGNNENFQHTVKHWKRVFFRSYQHDELQHIAESRLGPVITARVFADKALQLWSHRCAAYTGDFRISVKILTRIIDTAEMAGRRATVLDVQRIFSAVGSDYQTQAALEALAPIPRKLFELIREKQRSLHGISFSFSENDIRKLYQNTYIAGCDISAAYIIGTWKDTGIVENAPGGTYRVKAFFV